MVKKILPGHGSGGKLMNDMISQTIKEILGRDSIQIDDSALLMPGGERIAFTTDSYTVTPIFFPGGDIGSLAVHGTVNDLAVMGAEPKFLSCSLILEEGFEFDDFEKILSSMKASADNAGVKIVTGDTKVVPNGKGDKIYINTSGIGVFTGEVQRREIGAGDKIIVSGTLGGHG
ncbi:MAG: AIR synthase related protein, partial [Leptospirales bacterium]|nr:AIR synthase related protein [Leptospirales bacterium]